MKRLFCSLLISGLAFSASAKPKHLLVVSVTKGFRHSSIPVAERVIGELAYRSGEFTVEYAAVEPTDAEYHGADGKPDNAKVDAAISRVLAEKMSPSALAAYDGVIFVNTTGTLPIPDTDAFLKWLQDGHAFIGMHSATDTFHSGTDQPSPYTKMINGAFLTHGAQAEVECLNADHHHPATAHLGKSITLFDEIYILKHYERGATHSLLDLDKHPNSKDPGHFPIAYCHDYGKGRVFYTSLGHREDIWDPAWKDNEGNRRNSPEIARAYQAHILGGIRWALGLAKGSGKPQELAFNLDRKEARDGFKPLFNGTDLSGWRLRDTNAPSSWSAENGMLVNKLPRNREGQRPHGVDLVTDDPFWNFTVRYEYMVPEGSNSGFYLRGRHEIQIVDDAKSGKPSPGGNGSVYNHTSASRNVSRPAGEWQTVEATMIGDRVTVILNGVKIIDNVVVERATGSELDLNVNEPGRLFLQGDHGPVAFRNMRIKELK
jgi:type 1 glutamine amidotransferase